MAHTKAIYVTGGAYYPCLIVPDVKCGHADAVKDGRDHCRECGAYRYHGRKDNPFLWSPWRKPAILRARRK